jgi:hypothetical protein
MSVTVTPGMSNRFEELFHGGMIHLSRPKRLGLDGGLGTLRERLYQNSIDTPIMTTTNGTMMVIIKTLVAAGWLTLGLSEADETLAAEGVDTEVVGGEEV